MIIGILLTLLLLVLGAAYYTFRIAFYNPEKKKLLPCPPMDGPQYEAYRTKMTQWRKELEELPFEAITVTSFDGTVLFGRYYHIKDGAPLQLQFHGYRGCGSRDFCGGNKLARESGHNTLIVDQRAQGRSGGNVITFGIREREDCLSWVNYAAKRFGDIPIFLSGVSMGAATVLMAAELPMPDQVVGIMADSAYTSPAAIIQKVAKDMGFPPKAAFPLICLGAKLFGGFSVTACSAEQAVRHASLPILLIHGGDDRFVPCEMSREIAAACTAPITFAEFPDAGHGISLLVDYDRYESLVSRFVADCLSKKIPKP